jgi:hypothetical protein
MLQTICKMYRSSSTTLPQDVPCEKLDVKWGVLCSPWTVVELSWVHHHDLQSDTCGTDFY